MSAVSGGASGSMANLPEYGNFGCYCAVLLYLQRIFRQVGPQFGTNINGGGVDMAFLKHVPLNVKATSLIVWALLI